MIRIKHKEQGYIATADEVRRNTFGLIVLVHIPLIGWRSAEEFEVVKSEG